MLGRFTHLLPWIRRPTALVVAIHGGGWIRGGPDQFKPMFSCWRAAGFRCVAPAYRKWAEGGTVRSSIDDTMAAARKAIARWPALPVYLVGSSAGGLVAVMVALRLPGRIAGVALINPVLDLSAQGYGSEATPSGGDEALSPLHVPLGGLPRTLIIHGTEDTVIPIKHAYRFRDRLIDARTPVTLVERKGHGHGWHDADESDRGEIESAIRDFILANSEDPSRLRR